MPTLVGNFPPSRLKKKSEFDFPTNINVGRAATDLPPLSPRKAFFNYPEMRSLLHRFCVLHVTAPGQEDGAERMADGLSYPTMDELAAQVTEVLDHFRVRRYVGLGVGLGANVLLRHALSSPERVDSLAVVNATCQAGGWIEWAYQKRNVGHLRQHGVTQVTTHMHYPTSVAGREFI